MKKRSGWERALQVEASGRGMVGHAGAVLLHRTADRIDLVGRLRGVLRTSPWLLDRADVLVSLIVGIGLGAVNLAQAELLARHHTALLGGQASDSTLWRTLEEIDARTREKIGKARALVRARVWTLLEQRESGFPWIVILGKQLVGWVVIDMDATIIAAASNKEQAAGTFKKTFGHHPLAAWCGNTLECLAMRLRPGNAGSNTASEHVSVLGEALRQVPSGFRRKILVRLDGAGASHEFIGHLAGLSTRCRNLPFKAYARNQAWLLAANIASDLLAYLQLLGLDQDEELADAEPETLRATILHIPARLVHHARRRTLKIEASWPWAETIVTAWNRLGAIPAPSRPADQTRKEDKPARHPRQWPHTPRSSPRPAPDTASTKASNRTPTQPAEPASQRMTTTEGSRSTGPPCYSGRTKKYSTNISGRRTCGWVTVGL